MFQILSGLVHKSFQCLCNFLDNIDSDNRIYIEHKFLLHFSNIYLIKYETHAFL